jgi:catechol 2,3-dioxygenase-like lactoylglutathione lyase family enzyme
MKVEQRFRTPSKGECVHLRDEAGGFLLELNHYDKDSPYHTEYIVGEGLDHLAFAVEKFDDALDEARRFGHPPILEFKIPTFRWAYIEDPDGIWIELLERWPE